jgi:hypothetical protein
MSSEPEVGTYEPEPARGTTVPQPEAEMTPESMINVFPESERTSAEPESEVTAEPIPTVPWDGPFAEPVPDWDLAKTQLGTAWGLHVYGMGTTFVILAILSFVSIVVIATIQKLKSRGYFIALNVLNFVFGSVRAIYMFVDAYNARGTLSPVVAYIGINTGYPCLTTMFYILFSALFRLTKFQKMNSRIFTLKYLIGISSSFFVLQFTADIVVGYFLQAWLLAFLCEIFFVLWGFVFSTLFLVVFFRLLHATIVKRRLMKSMTGSRGSLDVMAGRNCAVSATHLSPDMRGSNAIMPHFGKDKTPTVDPSVQISAVAVVFFISISVAHVYGMISANSLATQETPDAWPWWTYNFILRILELCMAFTVLFAATGPVRHRKSLIKKAKTPGWTPSTAPSKRNSQTIQYVQTVNVDLGHSIENIVTINSDDGQTNENETVPSEESSSESIIDTRL